MLSRQANTPKPAGGQGDGSKTSSQSRRAGRLVKQVRGSFGEAARPGGVRSKENIDPA